MIYYILEMLRIPSRERASSVELYFLCCTPEVAVEQTVKLYILLLETP